MQFTDYADSQCIAIQDLYLGLEIILVLRRQGGVNLVQGVDPAPGRGNFKARDWAVKVLLKLGVQDHDAGQQAGNKQGKTRMLAKHPQNLLPGVIVFLIGKRVRMRGESRWRRQPDGLYLFVVFRRHTFNTPSFFAYSTR